MRLIEVSTMPLSPTMPTMSLGSWGSFCQSWRESRAGGCLHHRFFEPGKPIIDNITDAISGSRKTIGVISRRYLESEWYSREMQMASFSLFDEQKHVLILVFLD